MPPPCVSFDLDGSRWAGIWQRGHEALARADGPSATRRRRPAASPQASPAHATRAARPAVSVPVLSSHMRPGRAQLLEHVGALDQEARARGLADGGADRQRRRQPERARTRDDEQGDRVVDGARGIERRATGRTWQRRAPARRRRSGPRSGRRAARWARAGARAPRPASSAGRRACSSPVCSTRTVRRGGDD